MRRGPRRARRPRTSTPGRASVRASVSTPSRCLRASSGTETTERASRSPRDTRSAFERSSIAGRTLVRPCSRTALDLGLRIVGGYAPAARAGRRPARDRHAAKVVRVVGDVDQAPVGEVDHDQLRDLRQRGVEVDPGRDLVPDVAEQVQPRAALRALGGGLSLRGLEQLAPVVAALQLSHVAQEGLDVERLALRVPHRGGVLAHPDGTAVPREQAVLERADRSAGARALELGHDALAVVRVQEVDVQLGLLGPLRRGVTRHLRDRRGDVERL